LRYLTAAVLLAYDEVAVAHRMWRENQRDHKVRPKLLRCIRATQWHEFLTNSLVSDTSLTS
jgi:hypothetical protein